MASFTPSDEQEHPLDFELFQTGWVTLYREIGGLEDDCNWLTRHSYVIHRLTAKPWASEADALREVGKALKFPAHFTHNLNALNDCLAGLKVPVDGGAAIAIMHYDHFARADSWCAHKILDIMARSARYHMLFGRRLAVLVQTDDPKLSFESLASTIAWPKG